MLNILITVNQILMAGIAITAFSLVLFSISLNLRERVTRSFASILLCLFVVYSAESLASVTIQPVELTLWLRMQWVGIVFLPSAYLHFSDALLATTGKPSRGRRRWMMRFSYLVSLAFLITLPLGLLVGPAVIETSPAAYLQPTWLTDFFVLYYGVVMLMSWYNFIRALQRSATTTSRRRMGYLLIGSLAPVLGSFPFLLFSSGFASRHMLIFWFVSGMINFIVGALIVTMAYSVAFFGVSLPDRTVKSRMFKWLLRGPVTASFTLAFSTIVRRLGEAFGNPYHPLVPITTVGTILLFEYVITLIFPMLERWLFYGNDKDEIQALRSLEDRLITRNDLRQFLEAVLSAVCDRLQATGAYIAALKPDGLELVVKVGKTLFNGDGVSQELNRALTQNKEFSDVFHWGDDLLVPLMDQDDEDNLQILGLVGVSGMAQKEIDDDQREILGAFTERMALALKDRQLQEQVFRAIGDLSNRVEYIQQLRAASRFDQSRVLLKEVPPDAGDFSQWVKDALTHYWGGPKLTESPLIKLKVVQNAVEKFDGNSSNALRAILKEAIERVKPEGERKFTAEWVLYNILELKFLEGKKVREIAIRLAMSEADLYRKQRVAIEAVGKAILDMEVQNGEEIELQNKTRLL